MKRVLEILKSTCIDWCVFVDKVNGREVRRYRRRDGSEFMAHSKFDAIFLLVETQ
jgi:hypothetical protein